MYDPEDSRDDYRQVRALRTVRTPEEQAIEDAATKRVQDAARHEQESADAWRAKLAARTPEELAADYAAYRATADRSVVYAESTLRHRVAAVVAAQEALNLLPPVKKNMSMKAIRQRNALNDELASAQRMLVIARTALDNAQAERNAVYEKYA